MNLEDLRVAGVSNTGLKWLTNPLRATLFRLIVPYLEVLVRRMDAVTASRTVLAPETREALLASAHAEALAVVGNANEALEAARRDAVSSVRAEAMAEMRVALRQELAGNRAEMRAMSHRFGSVEDMLHTVTQWLEGVGAHSSELSDELRAALMGLGQRIDTLERMVAAGGGGGDSGGALAEGLFVANNPVGRFLVRHPDVVGDALIRGEFWDAHLKPVIEACADSGRIAIDAGAYIGFHSVFMSRHFARVHAFEPQAQAYGLLRANLQLNNCTNVEAAECGLYSRACWLRLASDAEQEIAVPRSGDAIDYTRIENAAALSFVETEAGADGAVRVMAIDDLNLDQVAFIKIDTQGSDLRVLQGARATIGRCRPTVAFEFERALSSAHGADWDGFQDFFAGLGYELRTLHATPDGKQTDYLASPA